MVVVPRTAHYQPAVGVREENASEPVLTALNVSEQGRPANAVLNQQSLQRYPQGSNVVHPLSGYLSTSYHFPGTSVVSAHQRLQHYPQRSNVVHPLPVNGSTAYNFPATSSVASAYRMPSPVISHPKFPSPMPNQFIVYLLKYCPQKTSVCFGCGNTLKPGGSIGNPPMDLVIVSHMARSWVQENQVFSKPSNVYFHCLQQCVQKRQPYFQAKLHCFIPDELIPFLCDEHALFLQQNLGITFGNSGAR